MTARASCSTTLPPVKFSTWSRPPRRVRRATRISTAISFCLPRQCGDKRRDLLPPRVHRRLVHGRPIQESWNPAANLLQETLRLLRLAAFALLNQLLEQEHVSVVVNPRAHILICDR